MDYRRSRTGWTRCRTSGGLWDPVIDPPCRRHVVHLGNRRITLVADNYGLSDLFDEHTGLTG